MSFHFDVPSCLPRVSSQASSQRCLLKERLPVLVTALTARCSKIALVLQVKCLFRETEARFRLVFSLPLQLVGQSFSVQECEDFFFFLLLFLKSLFGLLFQFWRGTLLSGWGEGPMILQSTRLTSYSQMAPACCPFPDDLFSAVCKTPMEEVKPRARQP